ncbi:MAG: NAD-dependent epimerase/dehydratase family protein [Caulobacteraceae bacterium]|nr:NAD-dependent epimerase/dehydratase family protein [Caulobacteraceae bacterium]
MSKTILVTGATGLVGANICRLGAARGYRMRALVRRNNDIEPLRAMGAEIAYGDITNPASLAEAVKGAQGVINCAAHIGGTWSTATAEEFEAVNQAGAINVMEAAAEEGVERTVMILTVAILQTDKTVTEQAPVIEITPNDPPYSRTKRAAYYEAMARAARGQDVALVLPACIYGPSPYLERALVPTSFNSNILGGVNGTFKRYLGMPLCWVFVDDVANIALAALERGHRGGRYLALGAVNDEMSLPQFANLAANIAGSPHRVEVFDPNAPGADKDQEFGTMARYLNRVYPVPMHDPSRTTEELGVAPTPVAEGLKTTVAWLKAAAKI